VGGNLVDPKLAFQARGKNAKSVFLAFLRIDILFWPTNITSLRGNRRYLVGFKLA
jgi:hypothetical protein